MSKNQINKKNVRNNKNYKIESLEPRLLMDASQGHTIEEWQNEISSFITDSDFWSSDKVHDNNEVVGLYCQGDDALKYAHTTDFLSLANDEKFFTDAKDALNDFGKKLLDALNEKYETKNTEDGDAEYDYLQQVVTGNEIKELIAKKGLLKDYEGCSISFSDDGKLSFKVSVKDDFDAGKDLSETFKADLYGTPANIQAEFELKNVENNLNYSFSLDGSIGNGVEFDSSAIMTARFEEILVEDENGEYVLPKYGVLDLTPNENIDKKGLVKDNYVNIQTSWEYTDSASSDKKATDKNRTSVENSLIGAKLSFKVDNVDKYFGGSDLWEVQKDIVYSKSFKNDGKWEGFDIENYGKFSMGKILEKLQELSSRLKALQNGEFNKIKGVEEFEDNIVDFDGLLASNVLGLMDLSKMLDAIIDNPPSSLQELSDRISNNPYRTDSDIVNNSGWNEETLNREAEKGKKDSDSNITKIRVEKDGIYIPFDLTYFVNYGDLQIKESYYDVALSQEFFEKIFGVVVQEVPTVIVCSDACLKFDLVIPFANSEKAENTSRLYELGLDSSDEQLATVMGAKALVADEMDHYYGGYENLQAYAESVASSYVAIRRDNLSDQPKALNRFNEALAQQKDYCCINSTDNTYALYLNMGWGKNGPKELESEDIDDIEHSANENNADLSAFNEMKASSASRGFVFDWDDRCEVIGYDVKKEKYRSVDSIAAAVSVLNAMFAHVDDALKDVRADAFDNRIIVSFCADDDTTKTIVSKLKKFLFKISDDGKKVIDSGEVFDLTKLSEIWVSSELAPAHYDQKTKLTITVGQDVCEFDIRAGYFNSATSVSEIASYLQEMINTMFHWDNVNKSTQLFVDSYEGKIRFVSMQDFAVDFGDEEFAQWLGYDNYGVIVDESSDKHFLIESYDEKTSYRESDGLFMKSCIATERFSVSSIDSRFVNVRNGFNMSVTVDGKTKDVSIDKGDIASSNRAIDFVELLQEKINRAFGWNDENCSLYVSSVNDYVRFRSNSDFSIAFTGKNCYDYSRWLGFSNVSYGSEDGNYSVVISNVKMYVSDAIDSSKLNALMTYLEYDPLLEISFDEYSSVCVYAQTFVNDSVDIDSVKTFAKKLEEIINGPRNAGASYPYVRVSAVENNRLCFESVADFTILFYSMEAASVCGYSVGVVGRNNVTVYPVVKQEGIAKKQIEQTAKVQTACMEIVAGEIGKMKKFQVDLGSLLRDGSIDSVKNCTVGQVLDEIVKVLNGGKEKGPFDIDGVTITAENGYRIESISDINGFTIASLLGLTGEYGNSVDKNRTKFFVEASLVDEYIKDVDGKCNAGNLKDLIVPRFSNFSLTINNTIAGSTFAMPVTYGVFGETIWGRIDYMSNKTTLTNGDFVRLNELKLEKKKDNKFEGAVYWDDSNREGMPVSVWLNQTKTGNLFKSLNGKSDAAANLNVLNGKVVPAINKSTTLNTPNGPFCGTNYSMANLYSDLYNATCGKWMKTLFGNSKYSVANVNLPIYGKTVLEIMGLDAKIGELASLLTKDRTCTTVQELVEKITNEIGLTTTITFKNDELIFEFSWSKTITNKLLELDALYFGRDDFRLSGDFKTYLNANLVFYSKVSFAFDCATNTISPLTEDPKFTGYVSLESKSICSDLEIGVVEKEGDDLKCESLQVESFANKESEIFLNVDMGSSNGKSVDLKLNGLLNVYRYGNNAGIITIKSVNGDDALRCSTSLKTKVIGENEKVLGSVSKGDVVVDYSGVDNINLKKNNILEGIRQSVDGLSTAVRRMQSNLNSVVASQGLNKIPLIGDSILNIGDSVSFLETDFIEPLRKYIYKKTEGFDAYTIAEKLYTLLGDFIVTESEGGLGWEPGKTVWWAQKEFNSYYKGIQFLDSEDEFAWRLRLKTGFYLEKNADFDLGFPGLGLKAEGGANVGLELILNIGFGYSKKDGAYILLSNGYEEEGKEDFNAVASETYGDEHVGDDLILKLTVDPMASIEGTLGFLAMTANVKNTESEHPIVLGVDLNDGTKHDDSALLDWKSDKNAKSVISLKELKSNLSVEANLRGCLDLQIPMTLGIGGYSKDAPHIDTAFNLKWKAEFGEGFGSVEKAGFDNIVFDCGSFVENTIGALTEKINKVIEPIQPLIKFLQTEIPVLNKLPAGKVHMTVLDLVKKFGEKKKMNFGFLDDIIEMNGMLDKLTSLVDKGYAISSWDIVQSSMSAADQAFENAKDYVEKEYDRTLGDADQFLAEVQQFVNSKYESAQDFISEKYANAMGLYTDAKGLVYKQLAEKYLSANGFSTVEEYVFNQIALRDESIRKKYLSVEEYVCDKFVSTKEFLNSEYAKALDTYDDVKENVLAVRSYVEAKYKDRGGMVTFIKEQFKDQVTSYITDKRGTDLKNYQKYIDKIQEIYNSAKNPSAMSEKLENIGMTYLEGKVTDVESFVESEAFKALGISGKYVDKIRSYEDKIKAGTEKFISSVSGVNDLAAQMNSYVDYGLDVAKDKVNCCFESVKEKWNVSKDFSSSSNLTLPEFGGSWEFPIFDDPKTQIMKMMMGGHADLVVFDMRPLQFNFDWQKSFAIIGPLCADVGFSFGVDIDLCFGYDTYGMERWAKSGFKNVGALIDGFYVADYDSTGRDIDEIVFHSGVVAGASICGRFGINVGLNLNVNLDFKDPNNDGKIRLTEMAEMLSLNPLNTFDVSASISARAYAYLDYFFGRKEWNLWCSGAFDLFKTASKQGDSVATQNGDDLVVSVGDFAANQNVDVDSEDGADTVTVEVKGSKKVKITIDTEKGNKYSNTYTIKGDTLCIYAGEGDDKIRVTGDKEADFNVVVYGGNGDDSVDLSELSLAEGRYAIVMGGAGRDVIKGATSGMNYLLGEEGRVAYIPPATNSAKKKVAQVVTYPIDEDSDDEDIVIGGTAKEPEKSSKKDSTEKTVGLTTFIFGGNGSDLLIGGSKENYIFGDYGRLTVMDNGEYVVDRYDLFDEGGDDLIYGNNDVDHIFGGAGGDFVNANAGDDEIYGGQGNDVIYGGSGDDSIYGDDGADVIFGDAPFVDDMTIARSDNTKGETASEIPQTPFGYVSYELKGQKDLDDNYISPFYNGGKDFDSIRLFDFIDKYTERTFGGTDYVLPVEDIEDYIPKESSLTCGSDVIDGGNGSDVIFGDDGRNADDLDNESAVSGNDRINGGAGNDFIDGDAGDDTINAGTGNDVVYGGIGSDSLDGGAGNDFVFGDDGWAGYEDFGEGSWFNKDDIIDSGESVFGETIEAVGKVFGISNEAKAKENGGDDTIIAGDGSDFVDGQSGNDTYKVQYMGGDNEVFTNVMDSGNDDSDSMSVLGTLDSDNVLVRASDAGLGMVALLPNGGDKIGLERVNYWKSGLNGGLDFVSVDSDFGSDTICIDNTLTAMVVDAGTGDDTIYVGQMFDSDRSTSSGLHQLDAFTKSLIKTSLGYLSNGNEFALTVKGSYGKDVFNILHASASLSIEGDANAANGGDNCNVYGFENGSPIKNKNLVSLLNDFSRINVFGSSSDDVFVFDSGNVLSSFVEIQSVYKNFPSYCIYGGQGENSLCVMSSNGKLGYYGLDEDVFLADAGSKKEVQRVINDLKNDDSEGISLILVDENGKQLTSMMQVKEGETLKYGIRLSDKPTGTVYVTAFAPVLSENEHQSGDLDMFFVLKDGSCVRSVVLKFDSSNYNKVQYLTLLSVDDATEYNANRLETIMYDVESTSEKDLLASVPNTVVYSRDSYVGTLTNSSIPCETIQFSIRDCSCTQNIDGNYVYVLKTDALSQSGNLNSKKKIWIEGLDDSLIESVKLQSIDGKLGFSWTSEKKLDANAKGFVTFTNETINFENTSRVTFSISIENTSELGYASLSGEEHTLMCKDYYEQGLERDHSSEYYYDVEGNQIVIYSKATGRPAEISGRISASDRFGYGTNSTALPSYYSRVGDSTSLAHLGTDVVPQTVSPDRLYFYTNTLLTLPTESNSLKPTSLSRPVAPSPVASVSVSASDNVIELQSDMPDFVKVVAGETIRLKVSAAKASSADVYLMVNSEDGRALPAITWSWDDSNKKRVSVEEDGDLAYQVNLSNAENEDDFIYVFLHAAKDCNLVVTASSV